MDQGDSASASASSPAAKEAEGAAVSDQHPDAALIEACAEFDRRNAADREAYSRDGDNYGDAAGVVEIERLRRLLDQLRDSRARTLDGIAARLRTVLQYDPVLADPDL